MTSLKTLLTAASVTTLAILAGCQQDLSGLVDGLNSQQNADQQTSVVTRDYVRFVAIGDMGTGDENQQKVANAIQAICEERGCDFAIGLGDNIYEKGVSDIGDSQFSSKFERPYRHIDFPFYMSLGNHDNSHTSIGDGLNNFKGEIQVEYTYNPNRPSNKWNMPARYYDFSMPETGAPLIDFFAMDSNPSVVADVNHQYWRARYSDEQQAWLENKIAASTGPWKIAFAHHPYLSNGKHGNAGWYDRIWLSGHTYKHMLEDAVCDKVDVIIAGHDHDLQWTKPVDSCGKTEFILSGAGGKTRSLDDTERNPAFYQKGDILGFFLITVTETTFTGEAWEVNPQTGEHTMAFSRTLEK
ncbi:Uncharacterised protein [BD1-7 clade bacterium]|uniref:Calcineurin-like phosphoesterase domain-containing protein n=1 Tax=BD1-7 clade bacterium TaxID=2029982 RepID=A0A5S9PIW2_9GAMM|nr:Uncharacterised protein [BD1-7 clade bacterium]CAA0103783.1 Uncharacterised protein [BD1-7 clade bacterium]